MRVWGGGAETATGTLGLGPQALCTLNPQILEFGLKWR